ncbi:MAG: hypothetical protein K6G92_04520 [Bacteroidaceae bacterium]|nr:hypothetical protein [Bacteroidaceae bacterium]
MRQRLLFILSGILILAACESYDCTLYNTVAMYGAFDKDGEAVAINDTLTITACGTDAILLNRSVKTSQLTLPLSYWQAEDTLILSIKGRDSEGEAYFLQDTIWVSKTNQVHYESPDCPTTLFHTIQGVRNTNEFIESITVIRSSVNYETTTNLQIHLL